MDKIKFVMLVTGQILLAKVMEHPSKKNKEFELKKPVTIRAVRAEDGQPALILESLNNGITIDGETLTILREHILYFQTPEEEIKNHYNVQFWGGIVTAQKPSLIVA